MSLENHVICHVQYNRFRIGMQLGPSCYMNPTTVGAKSYENLVWVQETYFINNKDIKDHSLGPVSINLVSFYGSTRSLILQKIQLGPLCNINHPTVGAKT